MPRYEFTEGSSINAGKFWDITLAGKSFTTTYGRIGANGQTSIKTFSSAGEAKSQYEKLIAEKVKKGYTLAGGAAPAKARPAAKSDAAPGAKRYLELGDKFFEVVVDGLRVKSRTGKIGAQGQTKLKELSTEAEAAAELDAQVKRKIKDGYVEVELAAVYEPKRNPDLEKAILTNPEDADAYMVYADWLQDQGDPRGELIALQSKNKHAQAKKLLVQHAATFLGPLEQHQKCYDGGGWDNKLAEAFTWKNGFIHGVRLAHNMYANETWKGKFAKDVVPVLFTHPSGRFVVELTLNENDDPTDDTLDDIFVAMAKVGPLPTIRKLRIGDDVSQISWYRVGDLGKLWKTVPNLVDFQIEAGEFKLGAIDLPHLVKAIFVTGGMSKANVKSIALAKWPKLEHLEVYFGDPQYGGEATVKDVQPLLDRTDMPKLRYLGVKNAEFGNDLVEATAKSKLLRQVKTLDFSQSILTDDAVPAFVKHKDAFKHLDVLDVSETYLSKQALKDIKGVAKKIVADGMRDDDDPEYRYVGVGE